MPSAGERTSDVEEAAGGQAGGALAVMKHGYYGADAPPGLVQAVTRK